MINLTINGEKKQVEFRNLASLVDELKQSNPLFAIAINETFVPKSHYAQTELNEGDHVELLSPMQGG